MKRLLGLVFMVSFLTVICVHKPSMAMSNSDSVLGGDCAALEQIGAALNKEIQRLMEMDEDFSVEWYYNYYNHLNSARSSLRMTMENLGCD